MSNEKVFQMKLQKVYPLLVAKAEKKGRSAGRGGRGRLLAHRVQPGAAGRLAGK